MEANHASRIWFILKGKQRNNEERTYALRLERNKADEKYVISIDKDPSDLQLRNNNKPDLNYRYGINYPADSTVPHFQKKPA